MEPNKNPQNDQHFANNDAENKNGKIIYYAPPPGKERHGCVTAWLIFMIIANSGTALMYLIGGKFISRNLPGNVPMWMMWLLAAIGLANVLFAILLLKWKKAGFWGFLVSSIATLIINISLELNIFQCLAGLIGIGILYGILQIKLNNVSSWQHLE